VPYRSPTAEPPLGTSVCILCTFDLSSFPSDRAPLSFPLPGYRLSGLSVGSPQPRSPAGEAAIASPAALGVTHTRTHTHTHTHREAHAEREREREREREKEKETHTPARVLSKWRGTAPVIRFSRKRAE